MGPPCLSLHTSLSLSFLHVREDRKPPIQHTCDLNAYQLSRHQYHVPAGFNKGFVIKAMKIRASVLPISQGSGSMCRSQESN